VWILDVGIYRKMNIEPRRLANLFERFFVVRAKIGALKVLVEIKLKSLIMAQIERWRQA
jgi:hypothetical protein